MHVFVLKQNSTEATICIYTDNNADWKQRKRIKVIILEM